MNARADNHPDDHKGEKVRRAIAILAGLAGLAVPGAMASPALALTTGTCNSTQCYASIHTDDASKYPWLSTWENAYTSHDDDLVNNFTSAHMGPYGGNAHDVQFCDASCSANDPQYRLYIGTDAWLQSHGIVVVPNASGYHGDCASLVSSESYCNGPQNSLGDTGWNGPYGVIQVTFINTQCNSNQWVLMEKATGHEMDEMLIDPYPGFQPNYSPAGHLIEVADKTEGNFFETNNGSDLPDYTSAAYWNTSLQSTVYDRMRILDNSFPAVNHPTTGFCDQTGPPPPAPLPTY